jgi:glycosyltransferase involved in cell wall biosynthesis
MIKISIVIPTYNRPQSLESCCASIVNETATTPEGDVLRGANPTIEIVVADDGSMEVNADKNRTVCATYGAVYCAGERNMGMAVARNRGIAAARGSWIVFLDDDVTCNQGWYRALLDTLTTLTDDIVGFEGRVEPSGDGVWDREVQNLSGGAYLTCHFGVRRSIVDACGMFDTNFATTGPYCEDHEFAARLMMWGKIIFIPALSVTHAPRKVNLWRYILNSPRRCRQLLLSDCYFYFQHPDRYHIFRSHRNFFGTYCSYLLRHIVNNFKRRSISTLLSHPFQAGTLVIASIIKQCTAWLLLYHVARFAITVPTPFGKSIQREKTFALWNGSVPTKIPIVIGRGLVSHFKLLLLGKSAYDMRVIRRKNIKTDSERTTWSFLRIDDVFLQYRSEVKECCRILQHNHCPFLAAVTGSELLDPKNHDLIRMILDSGGQIGLHGIHHQGTFGPFKSELLQMTFPDITAMLEQIEHIAIFKDMPPQVLVPPFNAIGPWQIVYLSNYFRVICGGPETARFTGRTASPVVIGANTVYFPSFSPFYSNAKTMLRSGCCKHRAVLPFPICLSTHFTDEVKDSFHSLCRLLSSIPFSMQPWNRLY